MSRIADCILGICETAKETLVPMFYKEFDALCVEFSVKLNPFTIMVMVETDIKEEDIEKENETDDTVKYYVMDVQSLIYDGSSWSDEQFKEHFKKAFEVLKKYPLSHEDIVDRINEFTDIDDVFED